MIDANLMDIPFHRAVIDDLDWYRNKEKEDRIEACDLTFTCAFVWAKLYRTEIGLINNCAVVSYDYMNQKYYTYPIGGSENDRVSVIQTMLEEHHRADDKVRLTGLIQRQVEELERHFPHMFEIDKESDTFDYVYLKEKLETLSGKKLAAKRNHIHRFLDMGEWRYEKINSDNVKDCWKVENQWLEEHIAKADGDEELIEELENEKYGMGLAFDHYDRIGYTGGILYLKDQPIAFTFGERMNEDTMVVHFEKALDIQGAYPMINQQFIINNCQGYIYINREDDAGDMGLRKAKLSYYPHHFTEKHGANESDITYAQRDDFPEIQELWQERFGDSEEYISFYLENRFTENNMMVLRKNGKILAMASLFPASLISKSKIDCLYVYAVASAASESGKGYGKKLLEHIAEKFEKPLVLQPGEPWLEEYYGKLGYVKKCPDLHIKINASIDGDNYSSEEILIYEELSEPLVKKYLKQRREILAGSDYIDWDDEAIAYVLKECFFTGGKVFVGSDSIGIYYVEDGAVVFSELISKSRAEDAMRTVLIKENKSEAILENCGGMIHFNAEDAPECHPYLALTLG